MPGTPTAERVPSAGRRRATPGPAFLGPGLPGPGARRNPSAR